MSSLHGHGFVHSGSPGEDKPPTSETLNIGLVGCGAISRTHLSALADCPDVRVTALCDVCREAADTRAQQFKLSASVFDDFQTFLNRADVEAVILCTPVAAHAEQAIACLSAGKHVLCEKPMADCAAEARRVADAARASGKVYLIDHRYLFDPLLSRAAELVTAPAFGRTHRMHLWLGNTTSPVDRPGIYQDGGGCMGDMAYHGIYYALRILGLPRTVFAVARTLKHDTPLDDNCALLLEYEHALASLEFSFTQVAAGEPLARPMMIFGHRQSLYADLSANTLCVHPDGPTFSPPAEVWAGPLLRHFLACIGGHERPIAGAEAGLAAMRVLDAVRASAAQAKVVSL